MQYSDSILTELNLLFSNHYLKLLNMNINRTCFTRDIFCCVCISNQKGPGKAIHDGSIPVRTVIIFFFECSSKGPKFIYTCMRFHIEIIIPYTCNLFEILWIVHVSGQLYFSKPVMYF